MIASLRLACPRLAFPIGDRERQLIVEEENKDRCPTYVSAEGIELVLRATPPQGYMRTYVERYTYVCAWFELVLRARPAQRYTYVSAYAYVWFELVPRAKPSRLCLVDARALANVMCLHFVDSLLLDFSLYVCVKVAPTTTYV